MPSYQAFSDQRVTVIDEQTRIRTEQVHLSKGDISIGDDDDSDHSIPDEEPVLPINIEDIDLDQISKTYKADKLDQPRISNDQFADVTNAPSLNDIFTIKPTRVQVDGTELPHYTVE